MHTYCKTLRVRVYRPYWTRKNNLQSRTTTEKSLLCRHPPSQRLGP